MLTIQEAAELLAQPSQVVLLYGEPDVRIAALRIAVSALLAGETVFWVEGANRFDLYTLTEAAKKWGVDPHPLLRRIKIARAFTVHQLDTLVTRSLPRALRERPDAPAVISDPLALCWDDEVPYAEARRIVQRLVVAVRGLASRGFRLVVTCSDPPAHNRDRARLLDLLRPAATRIIDTARPESAFGTSPNYSPSLEKRGQGRFCKNASVRLLKKSPLPPGPGARTGISDLAGGEGEGEGVNCGPLPERDRIRVISQQPCGEAGVG